MSTASFEKLKDATAKGKCLDSCLEAAMPALKLAGARSCSNSRCNSPSSPVP
eukprot:CAMPEP_0180812158 /NCGR_PEP_ID=MMETSP1038_2-20121128/65840_1 /TAXON_ID=632150 /ORGANISM="Azadinium spinosum, Strain 3D9" /LENGTH=51 /DNA_ID=CAMNT_0022853639 /DNA_START=59 /DNA_END=211 /DNA_ORIENTATION=-